MYDPLDVLDSLGHPRILVLGDIILDRYTWGDAEQESAPKLRCWSCEAIPGDNVSTGRRAGRGDTRARGLEADVSARRRDRR